ncbi:MAG: hypothetical protein HOI21_04165 [Bacteroidetes Order II. Incertae sedis bacterium]|nr:hypothetical protein [Bacteroidetes Order II. bacterium]
MGEVMMAVILAAALVLLVIAFGRSVSAIQDPSDGFGFVVALVPFSILLLIVVVMGLFYIEQTQLFLMIVAVGIGGYFGLMRSIYSSRMQKTLEDSKRVSETLAAEQTEKDQRRLRKLLVYRLANLRNSKISGGKIISRMTHAPFQCVDKEQPMELPKNAHPIEREILQALVSAVINSGYKITVHDGEETAIKQSDNARNILESMGHTEVDYLYWNSDDDTGMVVFVYGNEPEYVVADYSTDEFTTRIVETIIDKYQG